MDALVMALGPAFAVGFAVQRLAEILDAAATPFLPDGDKKAKAFLIAIASVAIGFIAAMVAGIRVLAPLGIAGADAVDVAVTALVVSAGTEGFNSIMKFLAYKKEEQKEETKLVEAAGPAAVEAVRTAAAAAAARA
jgi:hypothetical protein